MQLAKLAASFIALTFVGCATQPVRKPAQAATQKRADKATEERRTKPILVAPPPAYGNRVVVVETTAPASG